MNLDINQLREYDDTSNLPPKAKYLKKQLSNVPQDYKWIVDPITELADKATDDMTHKLAEGEREISKSNKDASTLIVNFEVEQRKKAYQKHLNYLKNTGENLSKKEIGERLTLVEKLVKAKHRNNLSMSSIHDDIVSKEVKSFLSMSNIEYPSNVEGIEVDRRRVSIILNFYSQFYCS